MTDHTDVREMLGDAVATLAPDPALYDRSLRRGRTLARRRRAGMGTVAATAVAALALAVPGVVSMVQGERQIGFAADGEPVMQPAAPGGWGESFTAPIDGRTEHTATWADGALVIWGGQTINQTGPLDSGAVWDGVGWRPTTSGPLTPRVGHAAVWTGQQVVIVGGTDDIGAADGARLDAAAYDPVKDTWEQLPPAPIEARAAAATVWTEDGLLVWGGMSANQEPLADGARYDAGSRTWQTLPPAPVRSAMRPAFAWTGRELLVWAGTEQRVVDGDAQEQPVAGAAYDPVADRWRELAPSPIGFAHGLRAAMVDERAIVLGSSGAALYDPADDSWESVPAPPAATRWGGALVWTGTHLLTWGGQEGAQRIAADGAAYDPASGTWTAIPAGPLAGRIGHTLTWTGDHLIVWGGMDDRMASYPDGAAYRPAERGDEAAVLAAPPRGSGTPVGFTRVEDGVLTAYGAGDEGHRLYGPGDGPGITAASLAPGSTTHAWRAVAARGQGSESFLLLEGSESAVSANELSLAVSSPHVDPRPVWGPGGDVFWIEMDDEETARLRVARWAGDELEEVFTTALAVPGDRPDPSAADVEPSWDGKSRFWLDGFWSQTDLPGGAARISLQINQPITEDFSNGTFGLQLQRDAEGSYALTHAMARLSG